MKRFTLSQALCQICAVDTIAELMLFESLLEEEPALYSAEALILLRDMVHQKKTELAENI